MIENDPDRNWQKVHWISPLARTGSFLVLILTFLIYQQRELLVQLYQLLSTSDGRTFQIALWSTIGGILGVLLLFLIYSYLAWRRMGYALEGDSVHFRSGIIFRNERQIRYSRIQAVDITRPLLSRPLGLGVLDIEAAGDGDSHISIAYLKVDQLADLRTQVLTLSEGAQAAPGQAQAGPAQANQARIDQASIDQVQPDPEAARTLPAATLETAAPVAGIRTVTGRGLARDEQEIGFYRLPVKRLLKTIALSLTFIIALIMTIAIIVMLVLSYVIPERQLVFRGILVGLLPFWLPYLNALWKTFNTHYHFMANVGVKGLRLHQGFTKTENQTLPPGKVHGIELKQPFLWRLGGWWDLHLSVAGFSRGENTQASLGLVPLAPAATLEEIHRTLNLLVGDQPISDPEKFWHDALYGSREEPSQFEVAPAASRIFDWFSFRRNALFLNEQIVVLRTGWLNRRVGILFVEHIQGQYLAQGPWQRRRELGTIQFATVARGATARKAKNFGAEQCARWSGQILERAMGPRRTGIANLWHQKALEMEAQAPKGEH
ncbi:hypothetical protein BSR28_06575 [Boudabousia liubingyangii]|uniref:PH domain-containing protein n=1 Tax=Boudabousia liubingyangii TaxID=1921764 RepID=UPI000939933C|nr:PH domain-containing protein [Boudabousia liubingyangii]OKL47068.1 hypothetical protein BSR28_06575 [Boudabousia liubingyangii]